MYYKTKTARVQLLTNIYIYFFSTFSQINKHLINNKKKLKDFVFQIS